MFKVSKSTIRNWINDGEFPEGKLFSSRCRRWSEEELKAYENSHENRTESAQGRKAVEDRKRAAQLGGASTGKRAKDFWDDMFEQLFKPSGVSPEEFAARYCEESNEEPLKRKYANGSTRAFAYKTILDAMKKRLRE
jgi:predicted DNA-binding transcriptional regulator AlpA